MWIKSCVAWNFSVVSVNPVLRRIVLVFRFRLSFFLSFHFTYFQFQCQRRLGGFFRFVLFPFILACPSLPFLLPLPWKPRRPCPPPPRPRPRFQSLPLQLRPLRRRPLPIPAAPLPAFAVPLVPLPAAVLPRGPTPSRTATHLPTGCVRCAPWSPSSSTILARSCATGT
jgi:hypothetical protein